MYCPFMAMVFPSRSGLFQQDNALCHTPHIVQEWFEDDDKEYKVLPQPSNSTNFNLIKHRWDVLDQQIPSMEAPPCNCLT